MLSPCSALDIDPVGKVVNQILTEKIPMRKDSSGLTMTLYAPLTIFRKLGGSIRVDVEVVMPLDTYKQLHGPSKSLILSSIEEGFKTIGLNVKLLEMSLNLEPSSEYVGRIDEVINKIVEKEWGFL